MKLTKYIRQAFVTSAMNDVPSIDYAEQARVLAQKTMDEALQTLLGKTRIEDMKGWLSRSGLNMPMGLNNFYLCTPQYDYLKLQRPKVWAELETLAAAYLAQEEARATLQAKLEGIAASATTRKALVEMLPEFEKYLSADTPAALRTLPAIANVMSDFVKAGWPKGTVAATA